MTITVNPNVAPTFTQVTAICSGATLAALPTTSTNGITGTWSPALNNLATTLYTFTSTTGQCALISTMTITVNPNVSPTFTQVTAICSGATLAALSTFSNNGITGTWSPALNNMATTLYTFTPTTGQCASTATMTITVNTIDITTSLNDETIASNQLGASYQWVNCDNGHSEILGETNQSFTPTLNGNYAVNVSFNNCTLTSNCTAITSLGLQTITSKEILMYPNPTTGIFHIDSKNIKLSNVTIYDGLGRIIYTVNPTDFKTLINLTQFADGIYMVKIVQENIEIIKKLNLQNN
jgi:hypothetical protein